MGSQNSGSPRPGPGSLQIWFSFILLRRNCGLSVSLELMTLKNVNTCIVCLQVENGVIDRLDILISEGKGDYEYQQLFTSM